MRRVQTLAVCFFAFSFLSRSTSFADPPPTANLAADIQSHIEHFDDSSAEVADAAQFYVWQMGADAFKLLKNARADSRPAVSARSAEILDIIDLGCTPGAPEQVFWQTLKFRHAKSIEDKKAALAELGKTGRPSARLMLKLLARERDFETSRSIFNSLPKTTSSGPPGPDQKWWFLLSDLLYQDDFGPDQQKDLATYLQADALFGGNVDGYVVFATVMGQKADAIERWRKRLDDLPPAPAPANGNQRETETDTGLAATMLASLYRADGNTAAALDVARKTPLPSMLNRLLIESGRWEERAKQGDDADSGEGFETALNFLKRSQYWRFADNDQQADLLIDKAREKMGDDKRWTINLSEWLLLCGKISDAIECLKPIRPDLAIQLMRERLDIEDALQLKAVPGAYGLDDFESQQKQLQVDLGLVEPPKPSTRPAVKTFDQKYEDMMHLWWIDDKNKPVFEAAVTLMKKGDYASAAAKFDGLWHTPLPRNASGSQGNPGALYLRGYCRVRSGMRQQGEEDMLHASIIPMNESFERAVLGMELGAADLWDDWRQQAKLNLETGYASEGAGLSDALQDCAGIAVNQHRWSDAVLLYQRYDLSLLSTSTRSSSEDSYLNIPWNLQINMARVERDKGNLQAAMQHLRLCNNMRPGDTDLAIEWVPQMESRHQQAMADELFDSSYQRWDKLATKYPRSGWLHNGAAWVAACCNRRTDEAVNHAKAAVNLDATNWAYLDTLAEAEFHAGHRELSVAAAKHAIELGGNSQFLNDRLKHFSNDPMPLQH